MSLMIRQGGWRTKMNLEIDSPHVIWISILTAMVMDIQDEVLAFLKELIHLTLDMMEDVWLTQGNVLILIRITLHMLI